jgi:hypothetical protein
LSSSLPEALGMGFLLVALASYLLLARPAELVVVTS